MPGYLIANLKVTDPEGFERYRAAVPPVIAQYGGRYLVRGGAMERLDATGNADQGSHGMLHFRDTMAGSRRFG